MSLQQEVIDKPKLTLREILEHYAATMLDIEEAEGELTPELLEQLKFVEEGFGDKMIGYQSYIQKLEAEVGALEGEAKVFQEEVARLEKKAKDKQSVIDKMKARMIAGMEEMGHEKKFQAGSYTWSIRKSESVNVFDQEKLPVKATSLTLSIKVDPEGLRNPFVTVDADTDLTEIPETLPDEIGRKFARLHDLKEARESGWLMTDKEEAEYKSLTEELNKYEAQPGYVVYRMRQALVEAAQAFGLNASDFSLKVAPSKTKLKASLKGDDPKSKEMAERGATIEVKKKLTVK